MMAAAVVVTALIYSGIPNPSWTVPHARAAALARAIEALPRSAREGPPQGGLGYSGVRVEIEEPGGAERTWRFAGGYAESGKGFYRDADRRIERMLLETGRGQIDPALLDPLLR